MANSMSLPADKGWSRKQMTIRIVSLNAWGGKLHARLMQYVADVDPDVLCLQEVTRSVSAKQDWHLYRDHDVELPQRANLFAEVGAVLPGHDAFFSPTARGELLEGDATVFSEFGLATYVRQSLPVVAQAVGFVHGEFSPEGWGPHPRARNAHCIRLFNYEERFSVTIAHMHGLRDTAGKHDTPARLHQADALVALIERVWPGNERLVVCGDFNVLPDSVTFEALGRLGLSDLVTSRGFDDTRTSHYEKPGRFADYMLANADVRIVDFDVVASPEVSDHRALLLDME
jgi:endonuclease/exonuclease/phosphatase family metal-dependent hydrolase